MKSYTREPTKGWSISSINKGEYSENEYQIAYTSRDASSAFSSIVVAAYVSPKSLESEIRIFFNGTKDPEAFAELLQTLKCEANLALKEFKDFDIKVPQQNIKETLSAIAQAGFVADFEDVFQSIAVIENDLARISTKMKLDEEVESAKWRRMKAAYEEEYEAKTGQKKSYSAIKAEEASRKTKLTGIVHSLLKNPADTGILIELSVEEKEMLQNIAVGILDRKMRPIGNDDNFHGKLTTLDAYKKLVHQWVSLAIPTAALLAEMEEFETEVKAKQERSKKAEKLNQIIDAFFKEDLSAVTAISALSAEQKNILCEEACERLKYLIRDVLHQNTFISQAKSAIQYRKLVNLLQDSRVNTALLHIEVTGFEKPIIGALLSKLLGTSCLLEPPRYLEEKVHVVKFLFTQAEGSLLKHTQILSNMGLLQAELPTYSVGMFHQATAKKIILHGSLATILEKLNDSLERLAFAVKFIRSPAFQSLTRR